MYGVVHNVNEHRIMLNELEGHGKKLLGAFSVLTLQGYILLHNVKE